MAKESLEQELSKRSRERRIAWGIGFVFVVSTLLQAFWMDRRQGYGYVQSLLYFGLVHLNVILIMFLVFLVSRNLIKAYLLRRSGRLGSSLRWRLVTSLLAFSLLPSIVLFAGSSYVIRQGFDRWFSGQVSTALDDAQKISSVHYDGIEQNLEFYSKKGQKFFASNKRRPEAVDLDRLLEDYPIQAAEVYLDLSSPPLRKLRSSLQDWAVPRAAVDSLNRAFKGESFSLIRQYGDGDLVQEFTTFKWGDGFGVGGIGVLIVSQNVPLGLKTRITDLQTAFSGYSRTMVFKNKLKANYTLVLLTLFVLVLFVVSWFGLLIAKSVTDPVAELMKATEAFREGRWLYRIPTLKPQDRQWHGLGSDLEVLQQAFNQMAEEVGRRGRQLEEANGQLTSIVRELEDREKYLEILISSIRRGVLVIDPAGFVQRVNQEALSFSSLENKDDPELGHWAIGKKWSEVFSNFSNPEEVSLFIEEVRQLGGRPIDRIFELRITNQNETVLRSIRSTGIALVDDRSKAMGVLCIFEDVSDAARLEKLAAWQEVAKRVAHEIKNPLTPIQISADRLVRRMSARMESDPVDGPIFKECLGQIQKQVRVIRDLVREFSQFAKLPEPRFERIQVSQFLTGVLNDYRFTHQGIRFEFSPQPLAEQVFVRGDPEYLRRLVVNLVDNAIGSMEEAQVKDPTFSVVIEVTSMAEGFVGIFFRDNGPGIPKELRDKIFDPYVSSKASGLGLGLPIVRRIAIEHMGRIRCEESTLGACFVLELPLLSLNDEGAKYGQISTHR